MQDTFLIMFGAVFGGKPLAYGRVDQTKLDRYPRKLLLHYRYILMTLCMAIILPLLMKLKFWTVVLCIPLAVGCYVLKMKYEQKLAPMLAPYLVKDEP
ncbi:MAG TPA: hypothetical protein VEF76_00725 [Patescibacteria group bacterium]|nr:hypothetical protein [Patescibacteria group bacterium]